MDSSVAGLPQNDGILLRADVGVESGFFARWAQNDGSFSGEAE